MTDERLRAGLRELQRAGFDGVDLVVEALRTTGMPVAEALWQTIDRLACQAELTSLTSRAPERVSSRSVVGGLLVALIKSSDARWPGLRYDVTIALAAQVIVGDPTAMEHDHNAEADALDGGHY